MVFIVGDCIYIVVLIAALKVFGAIPQPTSTSCLNPMEMGDRGSGPWDTYLTI